MKFPERERVIYAFNPLQEVICQIRFPRLLEIENRLPVEFQKSVAARYPLLEGRETVRIEIGRPDTSERQLAYEFLSVDRRWKLTLASEFIAISTESYVRWEEFRDHLATSLGFLFQHYSPAIFVRVGLRYVNLIDRKKLNLDSHPWHEVIRPALTGIISEQDVSPDDVTELTGTIGLKLDQGFVTVRHGLINTTEGHKCYLIDSDFYTQTPEPADIQNALRYVDESNAESGRLFRWFIDARLHAALKPQSVPAD